MFYRVKQFFQALFPRVTSEELIIVRKNVPPESLPLFFKQSLAEQRHALDVVKQLQTWNITLTPEEQQDLFLAALFHDCGKSFMGIKLWQRVFIVLSEQTPTRLQTFMNKSRIFRLSLQIASQHADCSYRFAREAGLSPAVCNLIREHHHPSTELGRLLQRADNIS